MDDKEKFEEYKKQYFAHLDKLIIKDEKSEKENNKQTEKQNKKIDNKGN